MKASSPYADRPSHTRWSQAVGRLPADSVDPVVHFPFRVRRGDRVATAGSCFAQHIARHLDTIGLDHFIAEPGHPIADADACRRFNYGVFSCRYGNIYTSRQLRQLVERAFGQFQPRDDVWIQDGRYFDPFRPSIQPGGFASLEEYYRDREQHLAAVRTMFETVDYFVFTLGLTECWVDAADGAVYPICPGIVAGRFDAERHRFHNLDVAEVVADLEAFLADLRAVNPTARVVLTVSPVPLAATARDEHVLVATTYSKAVLRVAVEQIRRCHASVGYFPSYEIITGAPFRAAFYDTNLRDVTDRGVDFVMRLFQRHATDIQQPSVTTEVAEPFHDFETEMKKVTAVLCEEAYLDAVAAEEAMD